MSIDYKKIRKENIKEYGEGVDHLEIYKNQYSDKTRFIYEILQNAEDAKAESIKFILFKDKLNIYHDGVEFDEEDVRGICGICKSTKSNNINEIGKFGFGFKSVYSFTDSPEIHSGDEHFKIKTFIRPYEIEEKEIGEYFTTFISLPFNEEGRENYKSLQKRLVNVSFKTLICLNNLKEIEIEINKDFTKHFLKEINRNNKGLKKITLIGDSGELQEWYKFSKEIKAENNENYTIDIMYKCNNEEIVPVKKSPLMVYFPTKEATKLGFLINGPYQTTPDRERISPSSEFNKNLIRQTASLVVRSLFIFRNNNILDLDVIKTMPLDGTDNFKEESFYRPIYDKVRKAFLNKPLLPADNGKYYPANQIRLARGKVLIDLLSPKQLKEILDTKKKIYWMNREITRNKTPKIYKYLTGETSLWESTQPLIPGIEIRSEIVLKKISKPFLEKQTDNWIIQFYEFLNKTGSGVVNQSKDIEIIRLNNGNHIKPFKDRNIPNVYLPPKEKTEFPTVKNNIASNDQAVEYLKKIGLKKPQKIDEVLINVLPKYSKNNKMRVGIKENIHDLKLIKDVYDEYSYSSLRKLDDNIKNSFIIRSYNAYDHTKKYKKTEDIYIPTNDLKLLYEDNPKVWFVSNEYDDDIISFFVKHLKIQDSISLIKKESNFHGSVITVDRRGCHERGLNGFDPLAKISNLDFALKNITFEKAELIWNKIAIPNYNLVRGELESSTRKDFRHSDVITEKSILGRDLTSNSWLPDKKGDFYYPNDISLKDLPDSFTNNFESLELSKIAKALGMKNTKLYDLSEEVDIPVEDLEFLKELKNDPSYLEEMKNKYYKHKSKNLSNNNISKPDFPNGETQDFDGRIKKQSERIKKGEIKNWEEKNRSIRSSTISNEDIYPRLKRFYTNQDGIMVCQLCQEKMPFKKKNGEYYFEKGELLKNFELESIENYIALCPVCAAKFKEYYTSDNKQNEIYKKIKNIEENCLSITLKMDEGHKYNLNFTQKHIADIKAIINQMDQ